MPNLIEIIKQASVEAIEASNPTAFVYGTVVSANPLKINLEQRLTLDASHLILTTLVRDFSVDVTLDHATANAQGGTGDSSFATHKHAVSGKKAMTVHLGLKEGEQVLLIRRQGGQKYIVLDRIR